MLSRRLPRQQVNIQHIQERHLFTANMTTEELLEYETVMKVAATEVSVKMMNKNEELSGGQSDNFSDIGIL